jgi:hypothetical protein
MSLSELFPLDSVGTTRSWDYSEPTLVKSGRYTTRIPMTNASFRTTFFDRYEAFRGMNFSNIIICGGVILDILFARPVSDIDIFIYGLDSDEEIIERAKYVITFLLQAERKRIEADNKTASEKALERGRPRPDPKSIDISAIRTGCVVTVYVGAISVPVQIVLKRNDSIKNVIEKADMAVCGIVFDGKDVFTSAEGRWQMENVAIRVNDGRFPRASRLESYFTKGFDLIFSGLDVDKLPIKYLKLGMQEALDTPHLTISYSKIEKKKIYVESFLNIVGKEEEKASKAISGRGPYSKPGQGYSGNKPNGADVLYKNIQKLASFTEPKLSTSLLENVPTFDVFAEADFVENCLMPWPQLKPRQVENTYGSIEATICQNSTLNFDIFQKYVKVISIKQVLNSIASKMTDENDVNQVLSAVIHQAINSQKDACNSILPLLDSHFNGKTASVVDVFQSLESSRDIFYGIYAKELKPSGTVV